MKWVLILSTVYLLQACGSFDTRLTDIQRFDKVPHSWHLSGRLGAIFNGKSQNAGFEVDFTQQNYKLTLTGTLGFGQIKIESNAQGLKVDNVLIPLSFKQWTVQKIGWYFPIHELGKIAFNQPFINANWRLKILSRYPNRLPKAARLTHRFKDIRVKLILKNIKITETRLPTKKALPCSY